ncbi:restriction endonuclease subunit S [Pseudidiomarina sp. 1APP75-27a]|uniref:restriction endonuclease subunit S n=1 Tax=Pseudidiomarina terrestris TaxID=2820060 RepID=UPI002B05E319|nr:restriction endonuclease subunit S [Pseudidiomarina sp. 1APP75-27a]MEA3588158.1 restriction endonuclease subunit S [Pseudidiomarina sp. 1APP75-27a]
MNSDWPKVRLGDYCLKIGSGATPKGGKNVYLNKGEVSLIRSQNVYNSGFSSSGIVYLDTDAATKLKNVEIQKNDILVNITGDSVARVCMAPEEFLPARVNQHVAIIRVDPTEFNPHFVRYFLATPEQQRALLTIASAGATRNALTKSQIEGIEICKPNLEQQISIAEKLKSLEDKIRINAELNQTLEQIAQAIFRSWFVDFEPVKAKIAALESGGSEEDAVRAAIQIISGKDEDHLTLLQKENPDQYAELLSTAELFPSAMQDSELGEIPEGWLIDEVASEIDILNGFAFKSGDYATSPGVFVLRTKNFNDTGIVERLTDDVFLPAEFKETHKKYLCEPYDYHLVMVGASVGKTSIMFPSETPALRNQNMWCFRPKSNSKIGRAFTKHMLDMLVLKMRGIASGSAREFFRKGDFQKHKVCFGTVAVQKAFDDIAFSLLTHQANNFAESGMLSDVRDSLLPKLLSGELEV